MKAKNHKSAHPASAGSSRTQCGEVTASPQSFILECCEISFGIKNRANFLYDAYNQWAIHKGRQALSVQGFGTELDRLGFRVIESNGSAYRMGLGLK